MESPILRCRHFSPFTLRSVRTEVRLQLATARCRTPCAQHAPTPDRNMLGSRRGHQLAMAILVLSLSATGSVCYRICRPLNPWINSPLESAHLKLTFRQRTTPRRFAHQRGGDPCREQSNKECSCQPRCCVRPRRPRSYDGNSLWQTMSHYDKSNRGTRSYAGCGVGWARERCGLEHWRERERLCGGWRKQCLQTTPCDFARDAGNAQRSSCGRCSIRAAWSKHGVPTLSRA